MSYQEQAGKGVFWTLSAVLMYAVMNGAAKVGSGCLSVWQIGVTRYLFGTMVLLLASVFLKTSLWGTHWFLQVLRALASVASFLIMVLAFRSIPISEAMVLFYTWPAFTCLMSAWVVKEPATLKEWFLVFMAFLGASIILWPEQGLQGFAFGHFLALSAAVSASFAMILVRRLSRDNNPISIYFYLCIVGSLVCLVPYTYDIHLDINGFLPDSDLGIYVLGVMALPSVLSHLFVNKGFETLRASKVGVLMTLELPLLAAFGVVFLNEPLTWRLLVGACFILFSGVALNFIPQKKPEANS